MIARESSPRADVSVVHSVVSAKVRTTVGITDKMSMINLLLSNMFDDAAESMGTVE